MARLTQVVNVLSTWNYIQVVRIKSRPDPGLKITIKRSSEFQKNFDDFNSQLLQKREERDRLKAEKAEAAKEETKEEAKSSDKAAASEAVAPDQASKEEPDQE